MCFAYFVATLPSMPLGRSGGRWYAARFWFNRQIVAASMVACDA
jgi:hypothetical protein